MKPKILLVDDEPNIIHSYSRGLRKEWHLFTAMSGEDGLRAIRENGPFSVIVSDFNMPRMDGITFLVKAREIAPDSVRIMLTGEGDFKLAMQAVNEGNIFRFITKPCPLDQLASSLNDGYKQYRLLQIEKEAREKEIKIAGEIQESLLIEKVPSGLKGLDVASLTIPSLGIDGDFIDFFCFSETKFDLVVGDVMGKGLHAAMVGAGARNRLARVLWRLSNEEKNSLEPARIMTRFREDFTEGLEEVQKFITMVYARFDSEKRQMSFVDLGHTPVLFYSAKEGIWKELKGRNTPLGMPVINEIYQSDVGCSTGDIFLFYSDGLMEGRNKSKELYEEERLMKCLPKLVNLDAKSFIEELVDDYRNFVKTDRFFDDLTIIAVKIE